MFMHSGRLTRIIAISVTAIAIGGGVYGIVSAAAGNNSGTSTTARSPAATSGRFAPGRGGSIARSGPAPGGAVGTVASVSTSKHVGQIPANYRQGSGTIVSGATANKATEAALTAYPGGIVDRVVKLSNGEYEVHNIGVNWPHHVFVNKNFKVVGAD